MFGSPRSKQVVGIDIGSDSIKLVNLKKSKKGYELLNFGMMPLPADTIVDGEVENAEAVTEALKNLYKAEKLKTKEVASSVSGSSVVIKKITVPRMTENELADSIQVEAEQYIPFDIDEVNVDFQIISGGIAPDAKARKVLREEEGEQQMDVIIVAVKKEVIKLHNDMLLAAGLKPVVLDLDVFALENCFELNYGLDPEEVVALVNIGATFTNVNIIDQGVTAVTRDIGSAGSAISETLQKKLSVGFSQANKIKLGNLAEEMQAATVIPHIQTGVGQIADEVGKAFDSFHKTSTSRVRKVYVSGGSALIEGIDRMIHDALEIETELIKPFQAIRSNPKQFDPEYLEAMGPIAAVAVGLATRRIDDK